MRKQTWPVPGYMRSVCCNGIVYATCGYNAGSLLGATSWHECVLCGQPCDVVDSRDGSILAQEEHEEEEEAQEVGAEEEAGTKTQKS